MKASAEEDRRALLPALESERRELAVVIEQMPAGVIFAEAPSGRITWGNEECARIFRHPIRPAERIADYAKWKVFRLDGRVLPPREYPLAIAIRGKTVAARELMIERGDGTRGVICVNAAPIRDARRKIVSAVAVFLDVSEEKKTEAEVRALNAELETRVAHRTAELDAANRDLVREIAERLRLESRILDISEREQRRLGQDLHDELGQQLAGIGMLAAVVHRDLQQQQHGKTAAVAEIVEMLRQAVTSTRTLARGFYPVVLEQGGLRVALKDLAERTEKLTGVRCEVDYRRSFRFPKPAEIHLYRIAQEALTNGVKHGQPRRISIECMAIRRVPILRITNDGRSFKAGGRKRGGLGLHILQYRARLIGGEVSVARGPNGGCQVTCTFQHPPAA